MQDIREIEFRDSGSNANTKICFKVETIALCSRLHTEGFSLYVNTWPSTKETSTEEFVITNLEYTTPLSDTTTSTQEGRHKVKTQSPLHKRDKAQSQTTITITSTQEGQGTKSKLHHNHLYTRETRYKAKAKKRLQHLVITIDHK